MNVQPTRADRLDRRSSEASAAHAAFGTRNLTLSPLRAGLGRAPDRAAVPPTLFNGVNWNLLQETQPRLHLLVIDEDSETRGACVEIGRRCGFLVEEAADLASAQAIIRRQQMDLVLMDVKVSGQGLGRAGTGLSLLEEVKTLHPETSVIAMTVAGTVESAVEAMRRGAEDYLTKPFTLEDLVTRLQRAAKHTAVNLESRLLRERLRNQKGSGPLIGHSPEMSKLYRILSKVAQSSHPVLIFGEHGTGKERVARSVHFNGPNASKPFIAVDCGAVSAITLESELFGHVKGAHPARVMDATCEAKDGLLASAAGGTIFLDDVESLSLDLQAKLVRVLQEKAVLPIGGTHTVPLAARILASTRADLTAMVEQGRFRRDLYFRLNVVSLRIPPLRSRKEDIPELVQYFLQRANRDSGVPHTLSDEALRVLMAYEWPSNVRELESAIERACTMSSGPVLHVGDLPSQIRQEAERLALEARQDGAEALALRRRSIDKIQSIAEIEKHAILGTIRHLRGDKLLAAKLLGIGKTTLYRKLKEYGVQEWDSFA
jgi:two-component system response regulator HydG